MPFYRVMLLGENFSGAPIGQKGRFGLYTTRWVKALNPKRAELKAVALVWRDPKLVQPEARRDEDRAILRLEKLDRVKFPPRLRGGGATWFEE